MAFGSGSPASTNTTNAWKQFSDGSNFIFSQAMKSPQKLGEYLAYYRDQYENSDKNWAQYDYEYTPLASAVGTSNPIPVDVTAPCNIDVAFWSTMMPSGRWSKPATI